MAVTKKQHYVPQFYLREFTDPKTPAGQDPYVWLFSKDGRNRRRRAPKNILWETDLYTLDVSGTKDLSLEKKLSEIECGFAEVVREKIKKHLPLTDAEHRKLCLFVATMLQRTVRQRDNQEQFYETLVSQIERLETHHGSDGSTSRKLRAFKKDAHKAGVVAMLDEIPGLLMRMSLAFVCVGNTQARFITSDDPVTLFNPELQWQQLYGPGLAQSGVELTMPVTPEVAVCMTWSNLRGYIRIPGWRVHEINRFTRGHCYQRFVANSRRTKWIWFSRIPLTSPGFMIHVVRRLISSKLEMRRRRS